MRKLKLITGKNSSAIIARMNEEKRKNKGYATLITEEVDSVKTYVDLMQDTDLLIGSTSITAATLHNRRVFGFDVVDLGDNVIVTQKVDPPDLKKHRITTLDNIEKSGLCIMFKVLGHTAVMRFDDEEAQNEMFEKLI